MTENIRERLSLGMHENLKFNKRSFDVKKLNDMAVREKYKVKISKGFSALENLRESEDINRPCNNT